MFFLKVLLDILEEINLIFIFYIKNNIDNGIFLFFLDLLILVDFNLFKSIFIIIYGYCFNGDLDWVKYMMLSFLDKVFNNMFYI